MKKFRIRRWRVTIKERGTDRLLIPELMGEFDERDVVRHFGLKDDDVEWYKMEEIRQDSPFKGDGMTVDDDEEARLSMRWFLTGYRRGRHELLNELTEKVGGMEGAGEVLGVLETMRSNEV